MNQHELKPNKDVFVNYRFALRFIYLSIILIIISLISTRYILFYGIIILLILIYNYISLIIRYKKEEYIFYKNRIIRKSGSIFTNKEVELIIQNITHVKMKLPFIEYKLFKTGHIFIESAGSAKTEVTLFSINNPEQIYKLIERLMKLNGFRLTKSKLIQKEKPSIIGVYFESFKNFFLILFYILFVAFAIVSDELGSFIKFFKSHTTTFIILFLTLIIILLVKFFIFTFLDLKKRVYKIYSDTITYNEGFLSKNYSLIPIENLSDSVTKQTIIDKIFNLYNVKISCQGAGHEILFKNMENGPELEKNIDKLISKKRSLIRSKNLKHGTTKTQTHYETKLTKDNKFTSKFKMDPKRTYIPYIVLSTILFPALPFWILYFIFIVIKVNATTYYIKQNSMKETFDFISAKNKEFNNDKITAIIFIESFIDKWFKTCSIRFWSIGSRSEISFTNIKKQDRLYKNILTKFGIRDQTSLYNMNSNYSILSMLKAVFPITLIIALGSLIFIVLSFVYHLLFLIPLLIFIIACILIIIYRKIFYQNSKFTFYKDYIHFTRGIFIKQHFFVLYDDIKDITTIKYPFSDKGSIIFNIAGERLVQQGKEKKIVSNSFKINYIDNIENKDELIDLIFYKRPSADQIPKIEKHIENYSPEPVLTSKQDLANTLLLTLIIIIPLTLISSPVLFLTGMFIVYPLIIIIIFLFIIWIIKVRMYIIQPYRVIKRTGILYKKQTSIVFNKLDHIKSYKGVFNKLFKNGSITIHTAGSSMPELTIKDISNFEEFYKTLKKYY